MNPTNDDNHNSDTEHDEALEWDRFIEEANIDPQEEQLRLEAGQESNAFEEHYPDPIKDQIDQWEREGFVFEESGFSQPDPANEDNFVCPKCNRSEGLFYYIWEHPTRRLHITRKGQEIGGRQATRYAYRCKACNYRWTDDPPPQGKPIPVEGGE